MHSLGSGALRSFSFAALVGLAAACGSSGAGAPSATSEDPAAPPALAPAPPVPTVPVAAVPAAPPGGPAPSVPAPSVIEESSFRLALEGQAQYSAATASAIDLVLTPRGGYHVNKEYPTEISVTGESPSLELPEPKIAKDKAVALVDERAHFRIPFKAAAGEHRLTAHVRFAVCTPETCVPDERTLSLTLAAR